MNKTNKITNFDRVTKDKQSLINFVREEVLDLSGPHIDYSIEKFKSSYKFNQWLDKEIN